MKTTFIVDEGYSLQFLVHAFCVFVAGGLLFFLNYYVPVPFFLAGIGLLLVRSGVEVDNNERKIRKFYSLFHWRNGKWILLAPFDTAQLVFTNEKEEFGDNYDPNYIHSPEHYLPSTTVRTITFDIFLLGKNVTKMHICEFTEYSHAQKLLSHLKENYNLAILDGYMENREKMKKVKTKYFKR